MPARKPEVTKRDNFQIGLNGMGRKQITGELAVNTIQQNAPGFAQFLVELVEVDGTKRAGAAIDREHLVALGHWLINQYEQGGDN